MFKSILLVYFLVFSQTSWADCPQDIQVINKGDVANCDGVLLSPNASKKTDEAIQDSKYYKTLSDKLTERQDYMNKENEILSQRLKVYVDESQTLASSLTSKENQNNWQKFIYFGLGVLATGVAVYGAAQLSK